jgi:histidinol-phosphatase
MGRLRPVFEHELAFANGLADRAADIGMGLFRGDSLEIRRKADLSVVTQADTSIEAMVREQVASAFPDDHVLGEEEGGDASRDGRVWIVDPIDATANYARGIPIWATLIALQIDGGLVMGLAHAPAIGERYQAVRGGGASMNGTPIRVSKIGAIEDAQILFAGVESWRSYPDGQRVIEVMGESARTRGFGDFWGHVLVARGAAEVMLETDLNLWDYAALQVIVEEAGGRMTQLDGSPTTHGGSVLTTNGVLHDELVRRLSA